MVGNAMDYLNDENQRKELLFEDVRSVVSLAIMLTRPPYGRCDPSLGIKCFHPLTNEGFPDEDYLVLAKCGFEECEIWVYKGEVNVQATFDRFCLFGVTSSQLDELKVVYEDALHR
jgi:hypothetical protein